MDIITSILKNAPTSGALDALISLIEGEEPFKESCHSDFSSLGLFHCPTCNAEHHSVDHVWYCGLTTARAVYHRCACGCTTAEYNTGGGHGVSVQLTGSTLLVEPDSAPSDRYWGDGLEGEEAVINRLRRLLGLHYNTVESDDLPADSGDSGEVEEGEFEGVEPMVRPRSFRRKRVTFE